MLFFNLLNILLKSILVANNIEINLLVRKPEKGENSVIVLMVDTFAGGQRTRTMETSKDVRNEKTLDDERDSQRKGNGKS
jgi:hypothetical protein